MDGSRDDTCSRGSVQGAGHGPGLPRVGCHQDITPAAAEPTRAALSRQCSLKEGREWPTASYLQQYGTPHQAQQAQHGHSWQLSLGTFMPIKYTTQDCGSASLQTWGCKPIVERQATAHQPPQLDNRGLMTMNHWLAVKPNCSTELLRSPLQPSHKCHCCASQLSISAGSQLEKTGFLAVHLLTSPCRPCQSALRTVTVEHRTWYEQQLTCHTLPVTAGHSTRHLAAGWTCPKSMLVVLTSHLGEVLPIHRISVAALHGIGLPRARLPVGKDCAVESIQYL